MNRASSALSFLEAIFAVLAGGLLIATVVAVSMDVVLRNLGMGSLPWIVQTSEYVVLWVPFLTAAWLLRRGGHVTVDLVSSRLSDTSRHRLYLAVMVVCLVVVAALTYIAAGSVWTSYTRGTVIRGPVTVPRWVVHSVVPVGLGLMTLEFARLILRSARERHDS